MQELTIYVKTDLKCHSKTDAPSATGFVGAIRSKGVNKRAAPDSHARTATSSQQRGAERIHADSAAHTHPLRLRPPFEARCDPAFFARRQHDPGDVEVRGDRRQPGPRAVCDTGPELPFERHLIESLSKRRL